MRLGRWMQTASGIQFWPLDPHIDEVNIEDIAHSLSMQCRFAGHCKFFYSVAEHSVRVAWLAMARSEDLSLERRHMVGLVALLHDASEAYLVDLPRPVKVVVEGYAQVERQVQLAILEKFGLVHEWESNHSLIKYCDEVLLATEARDLMGPPPAPWETMPPPLEEKIVLPFDPYFAKTQFLDLFHTLSAGA